MHGGKRRSITKTALPAKYPSTQTVKCAENNLQDIAAACVEEGR